MDIYEIQPLDGSQTLSASRSDFRSLWSDAEDGEAHQSTVNGDALFGSIARRSGSLQPLGPGQVHKVELGRQRLVLVHLRVSVGDSVISLTFLLSDKDTHTHKHCYLHSTEITSAVTSLSNVTVTGLTLSEAQTRTWHRWMVKMA